MKLRTASVVVAAATLASCAHTVPSLNTSKPYDTGPTVEAVVRHISCELRRADEKTDHALSKNGYLVSMLLLLQVDDAVGTTPTFGYTNALSLPDKDIVTVLGLDFNAKRRRTFTTTLTVDTGNWRTTPPPAGCDPTTTAGERLYNLQGDLRFVEIVQDGLIARASGDGVMQDGAGLTGPGRPIFGGEVQFEVTRALNSLGPTWTLRYWKGPSGANGLFNGRQLYTNRVLLTFADLDSTKPAPSPLLARELAEAETRLNSAVGERDRLEDQLSKPPANPREAVVQFDLRRSTLPNLRAAVTIAEAERARARAALREAGAQASAEEAAGKASAAAASRDLLNTMLLQNLPAR